MLASGNERRIEWVMIRTVTAKHNNTLIAETIVWPGRSVYKLVFRSAVCYGVYMLVFIIKSDSHCHHTKELKD